MDRRGLVIVVRGRSRDGSSLLVSGELTVASAHRSKVHPTTSPLQQLVAAVTTTSRIMLQLQRLLLMLPLSAGITLSLLFSLSHSLSISLSICLSICLSLSLSVGVRHSSGRSTTPISLTALFLLVRSSVSRSSFARHPESLPIQLHFLRHDVAAVLSLHVCAYSTWSSTTKTR